MSNLAYRDEPVCETLNGRIVAMSPRPAVNHNIVAFKIARLFADYLDDKPCCVFSDGTDVFLTENDTVVPDVTIICNSSIIKKDGIHGTPDLVVEVLSPTTGKRDRGYKKDLYESCGVNEYWIVDPDNRSIDVYLLRENRYILDELYTIYPDYLIKKMTEDEKNAIKHEVRTSLFPEFTIVLKDVFTDIL